MVENGRMAFMARSRRKMGHLALVCATGLAGMLIVPIAAEAKVEPKPYRPDKGCAPDRGQPQQDRAFPKYAGNAKWDGRLVYGRDQDLGVPAHVGAPVYGPWVEVGGRKLRAVRRELPYRQNGASFQCRPVWQTTDMTFEGLEDQKGKVLLPTVFRDVRVVPGRGVFIMSHLGDQSYEMYDPASGARTPVADVAEIIESAAPDGTPYWGIITTIPQTDSDPETANLGWRYQQREARLEVVGPDGAVVRSWDGLQPNRDYAIHSYPQFASNAADKQGPVAPRYLEGLANQGIDHIRPFALLSYRLPDGELAFQMVGRGFLPTTSPLPMKPQAGAVLNSGISHPGDSHYRPMGWMIDAPVGQEIKLVLDKNGQWSAPDKGLGYYRSRNPGTTPDLTEAWFSAYPARSGDGIEYHMLAPDSLTETGLILTDFRILANPVLKDAFAKSRGVLVVRRSDGQWAESFKPDAKGYASFDAITHMLEARAVEWKASSARFWAEWQQDQARMAASVRSAPSSPGSGGAARPAGPRPEVVAEVERATARYGDAENYLDFLRKRPGYASETEIAALTVMDPQNKDIVKFIERQRRWQREHRDRVDAARARSRASGGGSGGGAASAPDSWAEYRRQSAERAATLKAMQDYTYGRSTRNPYADWVKKPYLPGY